MKIKKLLLLQLLFVAANAFAIEVEIDGLWYEVITKTKEAKVIQYKDNVKYRGNVVINETIAYNNVVYNVTRIDNSAFGGCNQLVSITIPKSIQSIGDNAFRGCI